MIYDILLSVWVLDVFKVPVRILYDVLRRPIRKVRVRRPRPNKKKTYYEKRDEKKKTFSFRPAIETATPRLIYHFVCVPAFHNRNRIPL